MIEKEPKFHWQILEYSDWNPVLIPLHEAKSSRNQSMYKYRIYLQWSRLPEPTGTKTSHVSFIAFDIFKFTPLDTLPLRRPRSGCWHFLEGQYFTPSKTRCFGQITISLPSSSNKLTRASISSLSEATHDFVVCKFFQVRLYINDARIQRKKLCTIGVSSWYATLTGTEHGKRARELRHSF